MAATEAESRHFRASRGWRVWVVSALVVGLLGAGAVASEALWVWSLYGGLVVLYLARAVWGYSVQDGAVVVHRLAWTTRFDLESLQDVEVDPDVLANSSHIWGSGGFFALTGRYRHSRLGRVRVYASSSTNGVVLYLADGPVVLTPDDPDAFVDAVEAEQPSVE